MYQASSICGVSKHLTHVRNSISGFLKQMLVFWNTYRSTSKCGISKHLTHVCNTILRSLKHILVFWKTNQATTKRGVSKHLKHVCNSIVSVLKLSFFTGQIRHIHVSDVIKYKIVPAVLTMYTPTNHRRHLVTLTLEPPVSHIFEFYFFISTLSS